MARNGMMAVALTLLAATGAQAQTATGVFIDEDGWALTDAAFVAGCAEIDSPEFGAVRRQVVDEVNGLAAVKLRTRGLVDTMALARGAVEEDQELVRVSVRPNRNRMDGRRGRVTHTVAEDGNVLRFEMNTFGRPVRTSGAVVTMAADLAGYSPRRTGNDAPDRHEVIRASFIEIFARTHGIDIDKARRNARPLDSAAVARRATRAMVRLECLTPTEAPRDEPRLDEAPLAGIPKGDSVAEVRARQQGDLAKAIARQLVDAISAPEGDSAQQMLGSLYASTVRDHGTKRTRAQLLDQKVKYNRRWEYRSFALQESSLKTDCKGDICQVTGLLDWFVYSNSRRKKTNGISTVVYGINTRKLEVISEASTISSRNTANITTVDQRVQASRDLCKDGIQEACNRRDYYARLRQVFSK